MRLIALVCLGFLAVLFAGADRPVGKAEEVTISTAGLLQVSVRSDETGASMEAAAIAALRDEISRINAVEPQIQLVEIQLVEASGSFEVVRFARRLGGVIGPEGAIRMTFPLTDEGEFPDIQGAFTVADHLRSFGLQARLENLSGRGALASGLQLRAVPAGGMNNCRGIEWDGGAWGEVQAVPLCQTFKLEARLGDAEAPPKMGHLLILSSDGTILRQRSTGGLEAGSDYSDFVSVLTGEAATLRASPPVNIADTALLVVVPENVIVDWGVLFSGTPAELESANPVTRDIARVMNGAGEPSLDWSAVSVQIKAIASDIDAGQRVTTSGPVSLREYTISGFDITPYLPADTASSLFKVLAQAEWLANYAKTDGVPYKQHAWPGGQNPENDPQNLSTGIDCSRSIWFAFTRASLPYNRSDRYLATADMVTSRTWMKDEFLACEAPYRTGDVLVYRDDNRGVGHTVMVIDPDQRIAWGSHGWDGNGKLMKVTPDTGVEYQLIKVKKDWERWDSANMTLRSCWRYRRFDQEWSDNPASRAGSTQIRGCENMCPAPP